MSEPKIRFKSFNMGFLSDTLDHLGDFYSGLSGKKSEDFKDGSDEFITYLNVHKNFIAKRHGTDNVLIKCGEKQNRVTQGDIVFTQSSETPDEVGLCSLWPYEDSVYLNSFCFGYRLRDKSKFNPKFLTYLLRSPKYRRVFYKEAQGISRYNISPSRVGSILIVVPDESEQQKIATFFSTIDEKISLSEQKLEALELLKKGLMQKIFGQKIRFKNQQGNEYLDWKRSSLGELCSVFRSGNSITRKSIFEKGAYPVYGGNGLRGYTDTYTHDGEFALIGRQGALCGNVRYIDGKNYVSEHAIAVRANSENCTRWLYYQLQNMNLNSYSESSAQPGLSVKKLKPLSVLVPSLEEQERIADLFSTIDEKLKVQKNKLELLESLKKGFLQQMFV